MDNILITTREKFGSNEVDMSVIDQARLMTHIVEASTNPYRHLNALEPILVEPGYCICFNRVVNNGWSDHQSQGQKPLQGFPVDGEHEYIQGARTAQLVGLDTDGSYCGYEPRFDRSCDGRYVWINRDDRTWKLRWFMNDRQSGYIDHAGSANIEFLIFPL